MNFYFADLHIHIGTSENGKWIKIPTSRQLTVRNICQHASEEKGLHIIGLADTLSPFVQRDIKTMIDEGFLVPLPGGGYRYNNCLTVLLGAEIETIEPQGGMAHTVLFLPDLNSMETFTAYMEQFISNINLSTQNAHMPLSQLVDIALSHEALIIPAHVFTPYKSIYGSAACRISHLLNDRQLSRLAAIELGLSADTDMADRIAELSPFTFLTNSDAHSLQKIAREYTVFQSEEPDFREVSQALFRTNGRRTVSNFGLDPRLGKYHRTLCEACDSINHDPSTEGSCPTCGSRKIVKGVLDRINQIADYSESIHPDHRPHYHYQIPLEFIPGLGKKAMQSLLESFDTEMNILHHAEPDELKAVVGDKLAAHIIAARAGIADIQHGGGGRYGKVLTKK